MPKHVFLMDITRHKGPTQSLISSARAHTQMYSAETVIWFHLPEQLIGQLNLNEQAESVSGENSTTFVTTRIKNLSASGIPDATFHVISYDPVTLREAVALNTPNLVVTSKSLASIKRDYRSVSSQRSVDSGTTGDVMPLAEATALTKELLIKQGNTSESTPLLQMHLRNLLSSRDSRALKRAINPKSISLIKDVVETGISEGWLGRRLLNGKSGTEAIWLIEKSTPAAVAALGVSVPNIRSAAAQRAEEKTHSIIQHLKSKGFYSPKDVRDLVCRKLPEAVDGTATVSQIFRKASQNAQQSASSEGITSLYWHPAVESIIRTALASGALIGSDGKPLSNNFTSRGASVSKILPSIIEECDLFLLIEAIKGITGLTSRDAPSIAHALYKEAPSKIDRDGMLDRLYEVLARLGSRVEEGVDGTLSIAY